MNFEQLEDTLKGVLNEERINKDGLTMVYTLDSEIHSKLEEHIFFKNNPTAKKKDFNPTDEFEIDVEDFTILFLKKPDPSNKKDSKNLFKRMKNFILDKWKD